MQPNSSLLQKRIWWNSAGHVKPTTEDQNHTKRKIFQYHFFFFHLLSYCTGYDDLFSFSYMNSLTDYCDKVTLKLIKGLIVSEHLSEMSHITCNGLCTSSINGTPLCCFLFSVQCTPTKTHNRKTEKQAEFITAAPYFIKQFWLGSLSLNPSHKMQLNEKLCTWLEGWPPLELNLKMGWDDNEHKHKCFQHFLYYWKRNIVGLEHYSLACQM